MMNKDKYAEIMKHPDWMHNRTTEEVKQCRSTCPRDCDDRCEKIQGHKGSHGHIVYDLYSGNRIHRWKRKSNMSEEIILQMKVTRNNFGGLDTEYKLLKTKGKITSSETCYTRIIL